MTRQRIIELLTEHGPMTTAELAVASGTPEAHVRNTLAAMIFDGTKQVTVSIDGGTRVEGGQVKIRGGRAVVHLGDPTPLLNVG